MLSCFHLIPVRYGRTDGRTDRQTDSQTDRFAVSISRVSVLMRDKNVFASHGHTVCVKSMGEGKFTPLTTPTPLNRQSPNIAHVIMFTISPYKPHLVRIALRVTSPHIAKVTTQFFFFLCTQNLSTNLEHRPLNQF